MRLAVRGWLFDDDDDDAVAASDGQRPRRSGVMRDEGTGKSRGAGSGSRGGGNGKPPRDPPDDEPKGPSSSNSKSNGKSNGSSDGADVIDLLPRLGGSRGPRKKKPKLSPEQQDRFTDVGNADQLVAWFGNDLRFVIEWGQWIVWDGRRWVLDRKGTLVKRYAIETTKRLRREAKRQLERARSERVNGRTVTEEEFEILPEVLEANQMLSWLKVCQSGSHIDKMVDYAASNEEMGLSFEKLNQKPYLLNCKNGTLNLDTGELRRHQRSDYLTQCTGVNYNPDADCPRWKWFIDHAMGGDLEMKKYLQRVAGYSISGHVNEFAIFFHYGNGGRGKSTFLITLKRCLNDYAAKAPRHLLFRSKMQRHETELTTLFAKRFAFCAEVEENQQIDEALVKDLTSADPITARRMREDHWEFPPTHKAHVGCNYKPRIDGTDDGIWRRVHLVPWNHLLGPKYKNILSEFEKELEGILAWLVRGYWRWKKHGLAPPEQVLAATKQYRQESDTVGQFLREKCRFGPAEKTTNEGLRNTYENYCQDNGIFAMSTSRFNARMRAFDHGVSGLELKDGQWVTRLKRGWIGVGLKK